MPHLKSEAELNYSRNRQGVIFSNLDYYQQVFNDADNSTEDILATQQNQSHAIANSISLSHTTNTGSSDQISSSYHLNHNDTQGNNAHSATNTNTNTASTTAGLQRDQEDDELTVELQLQQLQSQNNNYVSFPGSRNISWEYKNVSLTRVPGYGFGIAVSGGSDNPHFANGDPAIAISDVLKGGPAEGKLQVNDRIISANGIKLENVDYGTAVQVLRDSGPTVNLIIKRRIINQNQKVTLNKITSTKLKNIQASDYGINLQIRIYVKDSKNVNLNEGDEIITINNFDVSRLFDFKRAFSSTTDSKLNLTVVKQTSQPLAPVQNGGGEFHHQTQPSYDSSNGNLYVQPPTRNKHAKSGSIDELPPPPPMRPPLPKEMDIYGQHISTPPPPPPPNLIPSTSSDKFYTLTQPRYINFIKKNQLGIRLSGGNNVGIYISAVQPDTPADQAGLKRGDRIIRVNDIEYNSGISREEAIEKLSSLKNESIVSLIVRFVPDFEKILAETEFHDKIYYRTKFELGKVVRRNELVVVYDTLSNSGGGGLNQFGWEGWLIDRKTGRKSMKVQLPNVKQAREIMKENPGKGQSSFRGSFRGKLSSNKQDDDALLVPYEKVIRKKVTWPRPIVVYSNFTDLIYERLCREFPSRFAIIRTTLVEEILLELRTLMEKGIHGLLQIKSVASFEKLANAVCPIPIVVKTEDKHILKDILKAASTSSASQPKTGSSSSSNYYSTLLRSFNKGASNGGPLVGGTVYKKTLDELQRTEEDLGDQCRVLNIINTDNWYKHILEIIETELKVEFVWINSPSSESSNDQQSLNNPQPSQVVAGVDLSKIELPNYNLPPPYAVHNSNQNTSSFVPVSNGTQPQHQPPQVSSPGESFYNRLNPLQLQNQQPKASSSRSSESPLSKPSTSRRPYSTESLNQVYSHTPHHTSQQSHSHHNNPHHQQQQLPSIPNGGNSLKRSHYPDNTTTTPLLAHSPVLELTQPTLQKATVSTIPSVLNANIISSLNPSASMGSAQPAVAGVVTVPAPQVDRTKKPQVYQSIGSIIKQKPIPPPKPTKIMPPKNPPPPSSKQSGDEADDFKQSYYLNLPLNSKSFSNHSHSPNKSAFELYRKPNANFGGSVAPPPQLPPQPTYNRANSNDYMTLAQHPSLENMTTGTFDSKGGLLIQRNVPGNQIPIELRIPEGAVSEGSIQTIWFHVVPPSPENNHLDLINGNTTESSFLISPLIKFGPEGFRFNKPVEIRIPQYTKQSNASILLGNEKNANWSKVNIQQPDNQYDDVPFKIVSLTIQQF